MCSSDLASDSSAKPNTAMTRKFSAWAQKNGATFYPVHPERETVLGQPCYKSVFDIPGDLDLAIILTGRAVDTFEEVMQRKPKFAVRGYTRCQRCGRPHSVYRKFGLCRVCLREMAHRGELPGVTKSSW